MHLQTPATTTSLDAAYHGAVDVDPSLQVAVLLCSFQGERFLAEQLDSIRHQTHTRWQLWVSDDGSTDGSLALLGRTSDAWRDALGADRLTLQRGPGAGSMANFMALTASVTTDADCFAWSDQDDVWEPDKLARAVAWLRTVPADTPALYGGRTQLIDAHGQRLGYSPRFAKPPCFANALVQSMAGGNTMVFNRAARQLLVDAGVPQGVMAHDWWAYQLIAGCGGRLHYDPYPSVRYRQHGDNLVGSNRGLRARSLRLRLLLNGPFSGWVDANLAALQRLRSRMPAAQQRTLDAFTLARRQPLLQRLAALRRSGIHRQTWLGNVGLTAAAVLNRL